MPKIKIKEIKKKITVKEIEPEHSLEDEVEEFDESGFSGGFSPSAGNAFNPAIQPTTRSQNSPIEVPGPRTSPTQSPNTEIRGQIYQSTMQDLQRREAMYSSGTSNRGISSGGISSASRSLSQEVRPSAINDDSMKQSGIRAQDPFADDNSKTYDASQEMSQKRRKMPWEL